MYTHQIDSSEHHRVHWIARISDTPNHQKNINNIMQNQKAENENRKYEIRKYEKFNFIESISQKSNFTIRQSLLYY